MHALNHTLDDKLREADGTYLDAEALQALEQYSQSYSARLETYRNLRDRSADFVTQALTKMAQVHPEVIQKHKARCQYDMGEVLRYIALSILRDDEVFFTEQMMSWLDTILLAYKQNNHCATAYRYLQDAVTAQLPTSNSSLIRPYLENVILTLQSHA
ncbi:phycobilisome protein [Leptolyngbya sp. AN02str]|uniref:phycobilisome protein n=1 Tax=Leptolyngbya sp. AN02str TaxID=3423363 RepID=UPI003D31712C